ncbi:MAG: L-aspartate oxidase [Acidobacteriota bacterium]
MNSSEQKLYADVLIIGSGISGLSAAIEAAERGLNIILINKEKDFFESNTYYAQGGIVSLGDNDNPEFLYNDIMEAGDGISDPKAVRLFVELGPRLVKEFLINKIGVPFCRSEEGEFKYTQEGSHSRRRILYVHDVTGKAIEEKLIEHLERYKNIKILNSHTAIDLLTLPHHSKNPLAIYNEPECIGAYVLDNLTEKVVTVFSQYTILATGGLGRIYLHTTNPKCANGDGFAMTARTNARLINMEYIQFHPTSLYHRDSEGFLISEALRGEGAKLKTRDGKTFMENYSELKDLAPRDEICRAIYEEMIKRGDNYVLLDLASYAKFDVKKRFPNIYKYCLDLGIDITKMPIPVVPAAHYSCGGINVDLWGRTSLKNLYAVGEVSATGLHGANRLASTSLLEGLIWGIRAAQHISENFENKKSYRESEIPSWIFPEKEEEVDPALIHQDWISIKSTMWNYVGIIRTTKRLERARADLEYLKHRIEDFYKRAHLSPLIIELRNGIQVALLVTYAALKNRVSRGAHYISS